MADGCDYAWERPDPQALAAAGYTFVCRYLSYDDTGKNLTAPEVQALHAAGLSIVLNWEYGAAAMRSGYSAGVRDATAAQNQAVTLGAPPMTPIYFSADWDVQDVDLGAVKMYLDGARDVLGLNRVGIYGGYRVVSWALASGMATWGWQTYAWSSRRWYPGAHLRQLANGVLFQGSRIDVDESTVLSFGQWERKGKTGMDNGFSDPTYGDRMAWRVDAMAKMLPKAAGGPSAGEDVGIVQAIAATMAQAVNNGDLLSTIESKLNALATEVATLKSGGTGTTGTVHVAGDLTVTD